MVTHEPDIAAYADRVITMRDGQIDSRTSRMAAGRAPPAATGRGAGCASSGRPAPTACRPAPSSVAGLRVDDHGGGAQALARNKMRSALTMLGVFIGVAALIAMVAVGQGANQAVASRSRASGPTCWSCCPARPPRAECAAGLAAPRP